MAVSDLPLAAAPATREASHVRWLVLGLALLTALRLLLLSRAGFSLLPDEAQYWAWAQDPGFGYFSKPPMIAWIIAATTRLFGDGEVAVRLAAPLLHAGAALLVYALAARLFDRRVALWSAAVFATLPGISFSALLITTDVPLLFCWAAALLGLERLVATRHGGWALLAGIAIGLGLLSKYAMAYFGLCLVIYLAAEPGARWLLRSRQLPLLLVPAVLLVLPNLLWNAEHGFVTARHVAEDARWSGVPLHLPEAGEFLLSQFGVFGPVLMAALLWLAVRWRRHAAGPGLRFALCFSVPVVGLVLLQALASEANANWAAPAYVAGTIAVTAWLLRPGRARWLAGSLALHGAAALLLYGIVAFARGPVLSAALDPFDPARGWPPLAEAVEESYAAGDFTAVLAEDRKVVAELTYQLRGTGIPVVTWSGGGPIDNAFQMTALPNAAQRAAPLWVTRAPDQHDRLGPPFDQAEILRWVEIVPAADRLRRFALARLPPLPPG